MMGFNGTYPFQGFLSTALQINGYKRYGLLDDFTRNTVHDAFTRVISKV